MNRIRALVILSIVILLGGAALGVWISARPGPDHPYFQDDGVLVMAHRGGRRLWPENTLYAFERAVDLGVDVLEMDLHTTADGAIVVIHDDTVDRTTDGTGPVQSFTLNALQALDAGYQWTSDEGETYPYRGMEIQIPTLGEVFRAFPDMSMNIEIKQVAPSITQTVCREIVDHDMEDLVLVASFDTETIRSFRGHCPQVASTTGEDEVRLLYGLSLAHLAGFYKSPAEAAQVPEYSGETHVVTPRFIQAAHRRNMDVHVWTVNDPGDMARFLEMGVDGLITDRPDLLLELLGR